MWNCHSFQLREPRAVMTWHPGISRQYVPRALGSCQGGDLSRLAETMRSTVRLLELWEPSIPTLSFDGRTPYLPLWAHSKINCVENRSDSGPGGPDTLYRPMITTVSNTPANQFVCSYTGCVDKYTRKPRSFRRGTRRLSIAKSRVQFIIAGYRVVIGPSHDMTTFKAICELLMREDPKAAIVM
jgi:hypothetical protein